MAVTFTQDVTPVTASQVWTAVAYSPSLNRLCAVGYCSSGGTNSHRIMTSDNQGSTWSMQDSGLTGDNVFSDVIWCQEFNSGSGVFAIAVNPNSGGTYGNVLTSTDGITWTANRLPENGAGIDEATVWLGVNTQINGNWTTFAYDNTLAGNTIHRLTVIGNTSGHRLNLFTDNEAVDDASRWYYDNLTPAFQFSTGSWISAVHTNFPSSSSNLTNVAVSTTGSVYATSGDVNVWETYSIPWTGTPIGPRGMAYSPSLSTHGRVVCLVQNGTATEVWTSDGGTTLSGLTWTLSATLATTTRTYQQVAWNSTVGGFIMVGGCKGGNHLIAASKDGITWVEIDPGMQGITDETWTGITPINSTHSFMMVGSGGSTHAAVKITVSSLITLSDCLPPQGPTSGGTNTVIEGTSLEGCQFTFGGSAATVISYTPALVTVPAHAAGLVAVTASDGINFATANIYIYMNWYKITLPDGTVLYTLSATPPADFILGFDWFFDGILYPAGLHFVWVITSGPAADRGWWLSVDTTFGGGAFLITNSRPKDPRAFTEISGFANSSAGTQWCGGSPGIMGNFNNHLVYAPGEYTVGTDSPSLRVFDGTFDRPASTLPNTSTGAVPKAVMSILVANATIYISTLDTGTDSTSWVGRVFSLNLDTGSLTQIGSAFPTGHVPYSMVFHNGRLWVGTHRQSASASGAIFFFRPDIDTDWTQEYSLATSSVANCTSLASYNGNLYIGTTNSAGNFAKVLKRDSLGSYTTSLTATGGTATTNNGFPAMVVFNGNLYASYFNNDSPIISKIYKFDNSSWTTAYTGSGTTLVPFIIFPTDESTLLALGGGTGFEATLLSTTDGSSWSDFTLFLPQDTPNSTGVPAYGVVVH